MRFPTSTLATKHTMSASVLRWAKSKERKAQSERTTNYFTEIRSRQKASRARGGSGKILTDKQKLCIKRTVVLGSHTHGIQTLARKFGVSGLLAWKAYHF